jgi:hypothetical protein
MKSLLRGKISSNIEDLQQLHDQSYSWLPSAQQIRPTPETLQAKHMTCDMILLQYKSFADYILHKVFNVAVVEQESDGKLAAIDHEVSQQIRFAPNDFPYQVEGMHYVLWFGTKTQPCPDDDISATIDRLLQEKYPQQRYDFAWYVNPKMTVPEFFHVQVFFTPESLS